MKKDKMMRAIGKIDDKYVEEAGSVQRRAGGRKWIKYVSVAACFCIMVTSLSLWLFMPFDQNPPDVSGHSGNEYYDLIKTLNALTYRKPAYENYFDQMWNGIANSTGDILYGGAMDEMAPESSGGDPSESVNSQNKYQEVTDNQVAGVIEADIVKRSDSHIFYLCDDRLLIYSIDGENSRRVSEYEIEASDEKYFYSRNVEMYLSADCKTVTVILPYSTKQDGPAIEIISLDVSDPDGKINAVGTVRITGNYLSSRLVDGKLLLISNFSVARDPDFDDPSTFLPQIDVGEGYESIPMKDIVCPEDPTEAKYTVVYKFDASELTLCGQSAYLSYSNEVYVSDNSVYLTHTFGDTSEREGIIIQRSMTEISRLDYSGESLEHLGSVTVEGTVKDQYSLDELDGVLRVVTTTRVNKQKKTIDHSSGTTSVKMISDSETGTSASLYCIRLSDMTVRARVEKFAPKGETVMSVRFDGEAAYVCTSVQLTDPVFFFDLSDLDNITYKDTGTIDGFSSSLINLGDGYLLGIGLGERRDTVKIEVYEERGDAVVSVCKREYEYSEYSTEYKSYFIDRENNLFGLGINSWSDEYEFPTRYVLIHFNGYELNEIFNTPLAGSVEAHRAVYTDGYFYMLGGDDFKVEYIG